MTAECDIIEMYFCDHLDIEVIATELSMPVADVRQVINDWMNGEYKTR